MTILTKMKWRVGYHLGDLSDAESPQKKEIFKSGLHLQGKMT